MGNSFGTIRSALEIGATVKLIGDSITAGGGSSDNSRSGEVFITIDGIGFMRQTGKKCWASLFADHIETLFPRSRVINNGCSNITSTHVIEHLSRLCGQDDDIVIIMIGTNDRKQPDGMTALYNNLSEMVKRLKCDKKTPVLMSPNPSTAKNEAYPNRLYHMDDVNKVVEQVASEQNVIFISHFNLINRYLQHSGMTIEELMIGTDETMDGLHPSDEAHRLIYKNIVHALGLR